MATPFAPAAAPAAASVVATEPAPAVVQGEPAPANQSGLAPVAVQPSTLTPTRRSSPAAVSVPTPNAAFARPALPVVSEVPPSSTTGTESAAASSTRARETTAKRSGVGILLLAAAGVALGVLGYRFMHRDRTPPDLAAMPVPAVLNAPAAASPSALGADPEPPVHEPAASATAADFPAAPPAPLDSPSDAQKAGPVPATSGVLAPDRAAAGTQRVTISTVPPKAKFFHFGKEVGTAPFVIDLPAGEKRAYEVWLPGHITRKVLVDGSKPEIMLGLRQAPTH
jgi:hypothetical protein